MFRRAVSVCLALAACVIVFPLLHAQASNDAFAQIDTIVRTLSEITGLPEKHPVPYGRMNKRQLRKFLGKRIKKTIKADEIKADELALKMFGYVPQDFNLRKSTMDLLTEQAAAFYDYDEKRLFLMSESDIDTERVTLAHELSHALVDQHFNLEKFMDEKASTDDGNLAHAAVVEGQASWLMIAYGLKASGQSPTPTVEALRSIVESGSASTGDYPVLSDAPLYIRQSLIFPYAQGTSFFNAVYGRMGQRAFAEVFRNPPSGSAQILHPDRYFAGRQPTHPALPELGAASSGRDEITEGSVSEFDHRLLLRQYASNEHDAAELAAKLTGGQFEIDRQGRQHRPVLRYASEWDTPESAAAFFAVYPKILAGKWRRYDVVLNSAAVLAGTGDPGYFITRCNGKFVTSVEGIADAAEWQSMRARP